jgi:AcrR family transcriptional regulator
MGIPFRSGRVTWGARDPLRSRRAPLAGVKRKRAAKKIATARRVPSPAIGETSRSAGTLRKEHLLEIAIELFARRGFDGVSIRDIAAKTGATLPVIYYHFGDKRGLYLEACLRLFSAWGERLEQVFDEDGPAEQRLFDYLLGLVESLSHDERFAGLIQREILEKDVEGLRRLSGAIFGKHFRRVAALCRELDSAGDPDLLAHTVYALVFGLAQLRPIAGVIGIARHLESSSEIARHVLSVVFPRGPWSRLVPRSVAARS